MRFKKAKNTIYVNHQLGSAQWFITVCKLPEKKSTFPLFKLRNIRLEEEYWGIKKFTRCCVIESLHKRGLFAPMAMEQPPQGGAPGPLTFDHEEAAEGRFI